MQPHGYVYILASKPRGTLYIGVTSDLRFRIEQHRSTGHMGFTQRYNIKTLVFAESFPTIYEAIQIEKRLKSWRRSWKIKLIEEYNPKWKDLFELDLGL